MSTEIPNWRENDGWRDKPITDKQAQLLHDLSCSMFAKLTRGEASDLIKQMLEDDKPKHTSLNKESYGEGTLEDNK